MTVTDLYPSTNTKTERSSPGLDQESDATPADKTPETIKKQTLEAALLASTSIDAERFRFYAAIGDDPHLSDEERLTNQRLQKLYLAKALDPYNRLYEVSPQKYAAMATDEFMDEAAPLVEAAELDYDTEEGLAYYASFYNAFNERLDERVSAVRNRDLIARAQDLLTYVRFTDGISESAYKEVINVAQSHHPDERSWQRTEQFDAMFKGLHSLLIHQLEASKAMQQDYLYERYTDVLDADERLLTAQQPRY